MKSIRNLRTVTPTPMAIKTIANSKKMVALFLANSGPIDDLMERNQTNEFQFLSREKWK